MIPPGKCNACNGVLVSVVALHPNLKRDECSPPCSTVQMTKGDYLGYYRAVGAP